MKIPMYNKGMGQAVATPAGKVSPRADIGAFAAPGQAAAQFANQAGQVAFQFGMAEKQAETDRIIEKVTTDTNQEFNNFTNESQATTVGQYQQDAAAFAEKQRAKQLAGLESKLTRNQLRDVTSAFNKTVAAKTATGSQVAYGKSKVIRADQANTTVADTMSELRSLDPQSSLYQTIQTNLDAAFDRWAAQGLSIGFTKDSYRKELSASRFAGEQETAKTFADVDRMRNQLNADRPDMTAAEATRRASAISTLEKAIESDFSDNIVNQLLQNPDSAFTPENVDNNVQRIRDGEPLQFVSSTGEVTSIDVHRLSGNGKETLIAKIKQRELAYKNEVFGTALTSVTELVQRMPQNELSAISKTGLTERDDNDNYVLYPEITDQRERNTLLSVINKELAEKTPRVLAETEAAQGNLFAGIAANDGNMTPEMNDNAANIVAQYESVGRYDLAIQFNQKQQAAITTAQTFKTIEFASLAEQEAAVNKAYDNSDTTVGAIVYDNLTKALSASKEAMKEDFVDYYQSRNKDKTFTAEQLLAQQALMGIPEVNRRITTNAQITQFQNAYNEAGTYSEKSNVMQSFFAQFGDNDNRVMAHLSKTGVLSKVDQLTAAYPNNIGIKDVRIGNTPDMIERAKSEIDSTVKPLLREEVSNVMGDYMSSITGGITDNTVSGGTTDPRLNHALEMSDIVYNTAAGYMVFNKSMKPEDAVKMAYENVIGSHYIFGRIDNKSQTAVRFTSGYSVVAEPMTDILTTSLLRNEDYLRATIQAPTAPVGEDQDIYEAGYFSDLAREGSWRTTVNDNGVFMVDQLGNLVQRKATDPDAEPQFVTVQMENLGGMAVAFRDFQNKPLDEQRNDLEALGYPSKKLFALDARSAKRAWAKLTVANGSLF